MTRLRGLLLTSLLLMSAAAAHALDPKNIETDWFWSTSFSSFTGLASKTVDIAGFGSMGFSTTTTNIVGFAYALYPVGSSATFTITQTTRTYSGAAATTGFNNPSPNFPLGWAGNIRAAALSTTTAIVVPAGIVYNGKFQALTTNPIFTFTNLGVGSTYYLWVEYGRNQRP